MLILPPKPHRSARERERERESKRRTTLGILSASVLIVAIAILVTPLGSSLVSAIQNIFIDGSQIVDIQVGGEKIDKVVFRGEVLWERAHPIQQYTTANCPTTRTKVYDARDNATYWIQKLPDGKCWMLTNLAYGGGGDNTYNDVKTITNSETISYTTPYYMAPTDANRTVNPQNPSTGTNGTGQYGYLYNWCAAMGAQTTTSACKNATTPLPDQNISICPAGWRLPIGGTGGEFQQLNTAVNGGDTTSPAGLLSTWLGMYSGSWNNGFNLRESTGIYWSSTQGTAITVPSLNFQSTYVYPATSGGYDKSYGRAIRCLAI